MLRVPIAYFARAESRLFHLEIIRKLKRETGCSIHFYCNGPQQVDFYRTNVEPGLLESVQDGGWLLVAATEEPDDPAAILDRARELEQWIGRPLSRLATANRHLGRGFAPGGLRHPRSFTSRTATRSSTMAGYVRILDFYRREFEEKGIQIAVNPYKEAAVVCNALSIPYRLMAGSRFENYHYWAWNEHYETPLFHALYKDLSEAGAEPENDLMRPYNAHLANRSAFLKSRRFTSALKASARLAIQRVYWYLRGYQKARRGYDAIEMSLLPFREYAEFKKVSGFATTSLTDLQGRPFIFFPLHVEPEAALQIVSPEYLMQVNAITALARELPAGVTLAVKEAFSMIGRRTPAFYEQILEHKNVTFLRTDELGLDCVKQSIGVATISGSAGLEACVSGRPVVSFGRHNIYNGLEGVSVVKDEATLYPILKRICNGDYDSKRLRREGRLFLDAVVAGSFDMGGFDYKDMTSYSQAAVEDCFRKLIESFKADHAAPPPY